MRPSTRPCPWLRAELLGERSEKVLATPEEARELDRHHEEGERDPADDHPTRRVEGAHVALRAEVVLDGDGKAVPGNDQAHRDARDADEAQQPATRPGLEVHEQ